jgi:PiT family inorganic phosphate transporter
VGYSLLLSPLVGFGCAAVLLLALRAFVKNRALYEEPKGSEPPPMWIRGLLILTCTGVSFRARLQRRPEGHGPDHADPGGHGAHGLCAEPRDAGRLYRQFVAVAEMAQNAR